MTMSASGARKGRLHISRHHAHPAPRPGFAVPQDRRPARPEPCSFPVHEVPHLVDLDDVVFRCGRRRGRRLAGRPDPLVDRDVAHPEQLGDHPLADVAQGVEQDRQRPHRRRLAAGRRRREAAAAGVAAVALVAVRHAVPDERSTAAVLAAKLGHGHLLAQGHERGGKRYLLQVKCLEVFYFTDWQHKYILCTKSISLFLSASISIYDSTAFVAVERRTAIEPNNTFSYCLTSANGYDGEILIDAPIN